ncbi:MAG: AraC family transcriptional regulator [Burkholderiales bacterium]
MSTRSERHTVSIAFVRAALANVPGERAQHLLQACGIAPELLAMDQVRVPAQSFAALWLAVAQVLDDEFFGLDARRMKVGSFNLLCHAALQGETVEQALRLVLRGFGVILDDVAPGLELQGDEAALVTDNRIADAPAHHFADETLLVMLQALLCWLAGRRVPILRVDFASAAPAHVAEYRLMFADALRFGQPRTALWFGAGVLSARVVPDDASLKRFLRDAPQSVFLKYRNETSWTSRLRHRMRHRYTQATLQAEDLTIDALAGECHVSPSTLQRRLEAEGSSFRRLKDEVRRDLAIHLLCHGTQNLGDIAATLGFQEASSFHRAFKGWTGVQPGAYRNLRLGDPAGARAAPVPD